MSARDELWDALGIDPDRVSREGFETLMDVHDHALAQQQRAQARKVAGTGPVPDAQLQRAEGWYAAADSIDPKRRRSGPVPLSKEQRDRQLLLGVMAPPPLLPPPFGSTPEMEERAARELRRMAGDQPEPGSST